MHRISSGNPSGVPADLEALSPDPFYGIMARRPEILCHWAALDAELFDPSSRVDNRIKEEARRTLAQGLGCQFSASLGDPHDEHPDSKEALAVAFAELVTNDHHQVTDSTFAALREEFSDEEIVELVSWTCVKLGSNILGALMRLEPATPEQVDGYAAFVAGEPAHWHGCTSPASPTEGLRPCDALESAAPAGRIASSGNVQSS